MLLLLLLQPPLLQADSLQPLRRFRRRWIITTFELEEEDQGPFPKFVGELFNNISFSIPVKYLIHGPGVNEYPEFGLFSIDDNFGKIYVHRTIDREKTPYFMVRLDAVEKSTGNIVDKSLIFKVGIKDINDNAPQFPEKEYNITVKENHNSNNSIFQIVAVDIDQKDTPNSQVTYSLVSQMPSQKEIRFRIDQNNGKIQFSGCLDYETVNLFKLLIKVSDNGNPQQTSTAVVNVKVEDGNNHAPVFTKEDHEIQIYKGQTSQDVLRLLVQDGDSPHTLSWRAKYKIVKGNEKEKFSIVTDPETNQGILNIIKPLDYEIFPKKKLVISVENEDPLFLCERGILRNLTEAPRHATVNVELVNRNDPPQFHPAILTVREDEGTNPGKSLGKYKATDPDGHEDNIRYALAHDPAGWVRVNESSGEVVTEKHIDRESPYVNNSIYTIIVHAVDNGVPPETGTGTLLLFLFDKNDNSPTLISSSVDICKMEEMPPIMVKAEDKDLDPFSGPFTFELEDVSGNIKDTWKLGKHYGHSVELLTLKNLPKGIYPVPFNILDKQGLPNKQTLYVRICFCPDGRACEEQKAPIVGVGEAITVLVCACFLVLAVSLLSLLWCHLGSRTKGSTVQIPYDEGIQTLIKYNIESENTLLQVRTDIEDQFSPKPLYSVIEKGKQNTKISFQVQPQHYNWTLKNSVKGKSSLESNKLFEMIKEKVGDMVMEKLYDISTQEEDTDIHQPHIYMEEGDSDRAESLSSQDFSENDLPSDFLDSLETKFSALEKIYLKSALIFRN
ncbi:cadherin-like protein 26 [Tachyglossus aculeatus]|uniref:cadherin-like protein 26 n=1 Tax=Tachyglossus aculeatus TaxID=9261 RepID=UPI0018F6299D|nr:cadherin-like protein 26 [Tachyglossus aculeatus]